MKITIEPHKCVAAGLCVVAEDSVFDQDEESGTVVLLTDAPREDLRENVLEAARICPAQAIAIRQDGTPA
ncbi:ferredoxin [Streptomyces sp. NPDC088747]|uniref:ferredoxin n=1 Tax=Streptomyces sp. NPDC088747 TaxID=3365886 RepID=UPI0037FC418D